MKTSPLLFASGSLAAVVIGRSDPQIEACISKHATKDLAPLSTCGDNAALKLCLTQQEGSSTLTSESLLSCLLSSGCDHNDALDNYAVATEFCTSRYPPPSIKEEEEVKEDYNDLRRRNPSDEDLPIRTTTSPPLATMTFPAELWARSAQTGDDCMTTKTITTRSCDVTTKDNGGVETGSCSSVPAPSSGCAPGKLCSFDAGSGQRICMDASDGLDVGGIVIAIIFGVLIAGSVATITFLCCRERKEQKRLHAKAEATALARAATRKKKAAEQRTPLMAERDGGASAGGQYQGQQQRQASVGPGMQPSAADPFHDRAQ